jgi:uncharacterized C2H2 Zn-finger protein
MKQNKCEECDAQFASLSELRQHMEIEHYGAEAQQLHPCRGCGMVFEKSEELSFHVIQHCPNNVINAA